MFVLSGAFFVAGTNIPGVVAQEDDNAAAFFRADRARLRARNVVAAVPALTIFGRRAGDAPLKTHLAGGNRAGKFRNAKGAPGDTSGVKVSAAGLGSRSVCVRLCDGFHFPVGAYAGSGDLKAHEAICSGLCPGAPTRLYVMRAGTEDIGQAAAARGGRSYAALPVALRHTVKRDKTCSCRPSDEPHMALVSLRKDFTLRGGDAIMTNTGMQVFRGAKRWPYTSRDFSSINRARNIGRKERLYLRKLERVSSARFRHRQASARVARAMRIAGHETTLPAFGPMPPERPNRFAAIRAKQ